jgi:hypothetical protein
VDAEVEVESKTSGALTPWSPMVAAAEGCMNSSLLGRTPSPLPTELSVGLHWNTPTARASGYMALLPFARSLHNATLV